MISVTEAAWRARLSRYIVDIDKFEANLTADTNFCAFPDIDFWMTNSSFNPGIPFTGGVPAGLKETHRRNNGALLAKSTE